MKYNDPRTFYSSKRSGHSGDVSQTDSRASIELHACSLHSWSKIGFLFIQTDYKSDCHFLIILESYKICCHFFINQLAFCGFLVVPSEVCEVPTMESQVSSLLKLLGNHLKNKSKAPTANGSSRSVTLYIFCGTQQILWHGIQSIIFCLGRYW